MGRVVRTKGRAGAAARKAEAEQTFKEADLVCELVCGLLDGLGKSGQATAGSMVLGLGAVLQTLLGMSAPAEQQAMLQIVETMLKPEHWQEPAVEKVN